MPVYKDEKRGTYYFKCRYKDVYGRDKQKMVRGFKKQRDAKSAEVEFLSSINKTTDNATFDDVFNHRMKHISLKDSTKYKLTSIYDLMIKPKFGEMKITDLKTKHVIEFKTELEQQCNSQYYALSIYATFKSIINHAVKFFGLIYDPSKPVSQVKTGKSNFNFIKQEAFDQRVEKIEGRAYKELAQLLFYTGLRVNEALALTYRDVDFETQLISISKTFDLITKKITSPKTESSSAFVPFPDNIKEILIQMKMDTEEHLYGFTDDSLIFHNVKYHAFRDNFKKVFPELRIHDLRHSYASLLINRGVDIYMVKTLLRHDNILTTTKVYGHLYVERLNHVMKVFDKSGINMVSNKEEDLTKH